MTIVQCGTCGRTFKKDMEIEGEGFSHTICGRCMFLEYGDMYLDSEDQKKILINSIVTDSKNVWEGEDKKHTPEQIAEFDNFVRENITGEGNIDRR
ncbi:MAG: hypothetical protein WCT11_03185 [Candidatus Magasanikbacteria bacterium]|jgi:hypothetical protein